MDEVTRLVQVYRERTSACPNAKLDVLMDLERIRDARVVPFLLTVLQDPREAEEVCVHVVRKLRNGNGLLEPSNRPLVADAICNLLRDSSASELRLQAALALGQFTDVHAVLPLLGAVCLKQDESIDLRYAAFRSLGRAGPKPESVDLLRRISTDEMLGDSARSLLSMWHIDDASTTCAG